MSKHDICFVGLNNLPVLAREYGHEGVGGEQVQHTLLSKALVSRGYRVAMVVSDHGQPDGATWDGITTYRTYRHGAGIPGLRFFHPRWTGTQSALARADATVYYVSCAGMLVGLVATFCGARRRRLVFRTASNVDCQPENLPIRGVRDRTLYHYGLRRADAVLTQTLGQQGDMLANYGVVSKVAGMLVDTPESTKCLGDRDIDVLWVNNITEIKRPDRFLALASSLPHRRFVMVGGTWAAHAACFEDAMAAARGCANVETLGRVPYHEVHAYYARAKVLVNTSDIEGYPNSYLQAWIHGTPVVTFIDPDGVIVREGLGGAPANDSEMAVMVEALLADGSRWQIASSNAMAYMAREFGEATIMCPYLEAFALGSGERR